ncbi:hypothetical protein [Nocardioides terrigena]|uniref:hypothetical protein n=1 Tax=Nocardioides terrigena TaxID=424797 RepID=UPI000D300E9C|nr:hypothetical protein [Nocardioides terrigena]
MPHARKAGDAETMDVGGSGAGVWTTAAVVLVVAAAVAGGALGVGGDPDVRRPASAPTWDVPAPPPLGPSTRSRSAAAAHEARQLVVRPSEAALGSAALVVRATQRPAAVRLVVRGPAERSVVRSVVVRSQGGRRLVLDGLEPGAYRWSVTSPTALPVSGRMRVADESPVPDPGLVPIRE